MILNDVCELIVDCEHKTAPTQETGYPSIRTPNIGRGRFLLSEVNRVSEETYEAWTRRAVPQTGDLIMAREAPVGNVAIIPDGLKPCLGQRTLLIRPDSSKINGQFLNYLLIGPEIQGAIHAKTNGATVPHLNMSDVRSLALPELPPLPIQRQIASALRAYDDLIDNCQRRIQVLENMARLLYREWFVNFRFPGHEKVRMVPSALGMIPEGWHATPFSELLTSATGGDWGSDSANQDETSSALVVRGTDFPDVLYGGGIRAPVRFITSRSLASRQLQLADVVVENSINAKSRCVGTTLLVDAFTLKRLSQPSISASFCKVFRPLESMIAPLIHAHFRHLRDIRRMEYYQNVATNGIGNFQTQKFVEEEHLTLPAEYSQRLALTSPLEQLFQYVSSLASTIANLRQTRDLLLPRLLSGQIDLVAA